MKFLIVDVSRVKGWTVKDNRLYFGGRDMFVRFLQEGPRYTSGKEFFDYAVVNDTTLRERCSGTLSSALIKSIEALGYKVWKYIESTGELKAWDDFS